MKRYSLIIIGVITILLFSGCSNNNNNYLIEISYDKFLNKIENKDTFFIEILQTGCSACQSFTPKLMEILNTYEVTGYKLNISNMSEEEYNEFYSNFGVDSTPEVIFITEGSEVSKLQRIYGNADKSKVISKLKSNGYIKE